MGIPYEQNLQKNPTIVAKTHKLETHVPLDTILDTVLPLKHHETKDLNESGSLGNLKSRSAHSSLYHHYELRVYADIMSHNINRVLSEFPILSQILAR